MFQRDRRDAADTVKRNARRGRVRLLQRACQVQPVFFRACGNVAVAEYIQRVDRVRRLCVYVDEVAPFAAVYIDSGQAAGIRFRGSGHGDGVVTGIAVDFHIRRGARGNGNRIPPAATMHGNRRLLVAASRILLAACRDLHRVVLGCSVDVDFGIAAVRGVLNLYDAVERQIKSCKQDVDIVDDDVAFNFHAAVGIDKAIASVGSDDVQYEAFGDDVVHFGQIVLGIHRAQHVARGVLVSGRRGAGALHHAADDDVSAVGAGIDRNRDTLRIRFNLFKRLVDGLLNCVARVGIGDGRRLRRVDGRFIRFHVECRLGRFAAVRVCRVGDNDIVLKREIGLLALRAAFERVGMIRAFENLRDLCLSGIGRGFRRRDVRAPAVRLGRIPFRQRTSAPGHEKNHQEHKQ